MRRRSKYGLRTYGTAEEMGLDPDGGKWVVTCDDHYTVVNVDTKAQAAATYTTEFCEECLERFLSQQVQYVTPRDY